MLPCQLAQIIIYFISVNCFISSKCPFISVGFPCIFYSYSSWSHAFCTLTDRNLLGSVWAVLYTSLHYWQWKTDRFSHKISSKFLECDCTFTVFYNKYEKIHCSYLLYMKIWWSKWAVLGQNKLAKWTWPCSLMCVSGRAVFNAPQMPSGSSLCAQPFKTNSSSELNGFFKCLTSLFILACVWSRVLRLPKAEEQ